MPLDDVKLHLIDSLDDVLAFREWLGSRDAELIGLDTETTGLERDARVRLVQLGGHVHGWAIPWDGWWGAARCALDAYDGPIITHNGPFDVPKLARQGLNVERRRIRDTMVMSRVVEPHMSMALKNQTARHVDAAAAAAQGELHLALQGRLAEFDWSTVPVDFPPYWQYGALDPVLTVHLHDVHWPVVQAECPRAYDVETSVLWTLEKMENYGAHIDVAYAREKYDAFMAYVERAEKWIWENYHVKAGSNAAIIKCLEQDGVQFDKRTASGALALDKEVLAGCLDHPLAQVVLQRRQLQKLATTYLRHFVEEVDGDDCIHPQINSLGARTSRMSMSSPNLQNLPRKSERNPAATTVRNSITTRHGDDGTLLMCDFDQIEMRGMAFVSGDPGLTQAFLGTDDFFVALAREVFQDPTLEKGDPRRQIVKNAGYSEIYGAGISKFAQTAGISYQRAAAVKQRWSELYPGTKDYARRVEREAYGNHRGSGVAFIRSPFDNRRLVAEYSKVYALVNYAIQQLAATVFKSKILALDAAGLDKFMVAPVHDEIVLDVPNSDVPDVVATLRDIMNDPHTFAPIPITASVSHGKRWGEKRDLEDLSELHL
jgi:DNA polymerase I-like protein with 3'-5' exonuclease and polymerase domains